MGLIGMVVFTTETRLKEIGIHNIMQATAASLTFPLSRGFLLVLSISALITMPTTYLLFENVMLTNFPYHTPVQFDALFVGLLVVLLIAFIMIGSLTPKAAKRNLVEVSRANKCLDAR